MHLVGFPVGSLKFRSSRESPVVNKLKQTFDFKAASLPKRLERLIPARLLGDLFQFLNLLQRIKWGGWKGGKERENLRGKEGGEKGKVLLKKSPREGD